MVSNQWSKVQLLAMIGALIRQDYGESPKAKLLELGCGNGSGRAYFPETLEYLGIERPTSWRPRSKPGSTVARYDFVANGYLPQGFEIAVCVNISRYGADASTVLQRLVRTITHNGTVYVGTGTMPEKAFRNLTAGKFSSGSYFKHETNPATFYVFVGRGPLE